jgi:hypothetical protein
MRWCGRWSVPDGADTALESRHLLQRMVDYLLGQGVRQFLDLGSGLPSMANTHQIAHRTAPEARVVYVDVDPLVSTSAAALMAGRGVVTLRADLREPEQVLSNTQVRDLLDFGQPGTSAGLASRTGPQAEGELHLSTSPRGLPSQDGNWLNAAANRGKQQL